MTLYKDRADAGKALAKELTRFKDAEETVVVGLPRGGVVVAYEVAKALNLPLDIVCPRKLGAPGNPEFAIGAVTETGSPIFNEEAFYHLSISDAYLEKEIAEQTEIARRRLEKYRKGLPPRSFENKRVLVVDDGLATGSTMKAALHSLREEGASSLIACVPVSPPDTAREIEESADELVCLAIPPFFSAVGQFYDSFFSTEDEEVIALLQMARKP